MQAFFPNGNFGIHPFTVLLFLYMKSLTVTLHWLQAKQPIISQVSKIP